MPGLVTMTECMANNFASAIKSINQELHQRGHVNTADTVNMNETIDIEDDTNPVSEAVLRQRQLITDMRVENYDVIRFSTYRTACKLRFIQRKTSMHLVDLWNMIESFRENGLNSMDLQEEVNVSRFQSLLTSVYHSLNKRLSITAQIDENSHANLLMHWILSIYDKDDIGRLRVFSIKTSLVTLCSGKLMDKLRYIFSLICDSGGYMQRHLFDQYLQEVLLLPSAVYEGPSFGYNKTALQSCFDGKTRVNVNDFLDTLMTEPGPQCLMWLPILHRMAQVENVLHPVECEACHRESFTGFRYKCQRCFNYHLCQECFWRGATSGNHSNEHRVKEYSSYSPSKDLTNSLRKSFKCVPTHTNSKIPKFPETPEKTIDLSYIVPATPVPVHNGFHDPHRRSKSVDCSSQGTNNRSPSKFYNSLDSSMMDDEHRLIARYAARLAANANNASRSPTELGFTLDSSHAQRDLISQLEAKNREIMKEIQHLRYEQEQQNLLHLNTPTSTRNPTLLAELRLLRQRRDELETRMTSLQDSRKDLMVQLEGLMKLLKSHSPRSSPNTSPRAHEPALAHTPHSAPPSTYNSYNPYPQRAASAPPTPGDTLSSLSGDVSQAFGHPSSSSMITGAPSAASSVRSLRQDLLVAADSVTNAMSSLVKELNSEASSSEDESMRSTDNGLDISSRLDELAQWREDMKQHAIQENDFMAQLQARRTTPKTNGMDNHYIQNYPDPYRSQISGDEGDPFAREENTNRLKNENNTRSEMYDRDPKLQIFPNKYLTDEDSCLETDQESYIRTDDEEGGNTEWEESMRRWVNR